MMNDKEYMMTEFESKCYGMSAAEIEEHYINSITARLSGLEMECMSVLSDCQEELSVGSCDTARVVRQLNVVKYILHSMMASKVAV